MRDGSVSILNSFIVSQARWERHLAKLRFAGRGEASNSCPIDDANRNFLSIAKRSLGRDNFLAR